MHFFVYDNRELEEACRDLKEALLKRNPNSVASLLHANAVPESIVEERKRHEEIIENLRDELAHAKSEHERSLRSLRQEYEKLRVQYDAAKLRADSMPTTSTAAPAALKGKSSSAMPKTLAQATARIK